MVITFDYIREPKVIRLFDKITDSCYLSLTTIIEITSYSNEYESNGLITFIKSINLSKKKVIGVVIKEIN